MEKSFDMKHLLKKLITIPAKGRTGTGRIMSKLVGTTKPHSRWLWGYYGMEELQQNCGAASRRLCSKWCEAVVHYFRGFWICSNSRWNELATPEEMKLSVISLFSGLCFIFSPASSISAKLFHSLSHWTLLRMWRELNGWSHFFWGCHLNWIYK